MKVSSSYLWLLSSIVSVFISFTGHVEADTIRVTTTQDQFDLPNLITGESANNDCSLREAIETFNEMAGLEGAVQIPACEPIRQGGGFLPALSIEIHLPAGTYTIGDDFSEEEQELGNARGDFLLYAGRNVVIEKAPGDEGDVVIDARQRDRLFNIEGNFGRTVTFRNLTLQNGRPVMHDRSSTDGGAIKARVEISLVIEQCKFLDNQTSYIFNDNGRNEYDFGFGGAIYFDSGESFYVRDSLFERNLGSSPEGLPQDAQIDVVTGRGSAIYALDIGEARISRSSFVGNETLGIGTVVIRMDLDAPSMQVPMIDSSKFTRNRADISSALELVPGAIIQGNLFYQNESRSSAARIFNYSEANYSTLIQSNTWAENSGSQLIDYSAPEEPIDIPHEAFVRFNTFVQNDARILRSRGFGLLEFSANIFMGTGNVPNLICDLENPDLLRSQGYNLFYRENFSCGDPAETDIVLEENTEEAWANEIEFVDLEDPNWNGTIPLTEPSQARNAIDEVISLCANAGRDQLGNRRPDPENGQCDIGAIEMGSIPPEPDEPMGGAGGEAQEPMDNSGGNGGENMMPVDPPFAGTGGTGEAVGGNGGAVIIGGAETGEGDAGGQDDMPPSMNLGGMNGQGGSAGENSEAIAGQDEPQNTGGDEAPVNPGGTKGKSSGCQCTLSASTTQIPSWSGLIFPALALVLRRRKRSTK